MISGMLFLALMFPVVPALAQEETETAGASLGKEIDEENQIVPYSIMEGWVQDANGWWYQYSDGSYPAEAWRKIGDTWYYFNSSGYLVENNTYEKGTLKGIDVSAWQGEIDWQLVKNFGIQFAFVRIGHGSQEVDKYFARNMQGAAAAGIPTGVYYYSTAVTEAEAVRDAQFVIDSMNGYLVSYPVAIDLEDKSQESLSKYQLGKIAKIFCDEIRAAGYTPMLYCNENWYKNYIDITQIENVEKWIARYNVKYTDSISRGVWQCSSKGRVDGINGNVDIDFGYKDYTQIVTPRTSAEPGYQKTKGAWQRNSRGWWFRYWDGGYPVDAWEQILGEWYLFDKEGYMVTGWQKIDET